MIFSNGGLARLKAVLAGPAIRFGLSLAFASAFIACDGKGTDRRPTPI